MPKARTLLIEGFKSFPVMQHFLTFIHFRAGQWVDFFIPGLAKVGGFSMWSPPVKLEEDSELELAIKRSTWPPAHWVHTKAEVGSELSVKIGELYWII
jgi:hypothetical protein